MELLKFSSFYFEDKLIFECFKTNTDLYEKLLWWHQLILHIFRCLIFHLDRSCHVQQTCGLTATNISGHIDGESEF